MNRQDANTAASNMGNRPVRRMPERRTGCEESRCALPSKRATRAGTGKPI